MEFEVADWRAESSSRYINSSGDRHPKKSKEGPTSRPIEESRWRSVRKARKGARPEPEATRIMGCFGRVGRRNLEVRSWV